MNSEKIMENLDSAYKALNQNSSVRDALRQAQTAISRVNALLNDKFKSIYETLDTALINVEEAEEEIMSATNDTNFNQSEIDNIEERLFNLKTLARKHNVLPDELPTVWQNMIDKLTNLSCGEENLIKLRQICEKSKKQYLEIAQKVSKSRKATALILDEKIRAELPDLKMDKAKFITEINEKPENAWNADGIDEVCFMVSTNPNTPYGALSKIASGGELARFMLILKTNLAQTSQVETMIFDEVDTGIGGATARAVGEKLAQLGEKVQVLVVTHSPQVAALSKTHFKVEKITENNVTTTHLHQLNEQEKMEEIARMLSGEYITDEARAAAKVLIGA